MKSTQFCAIQCSIFLVGSIAATNPITKMVFLVLAVAYLIGQVATMRNDD